MSTNLSPTVEIAEGITMPLVGLATLSVIFNL
jgi:hypothetical protein